MKYLKIETGTEELFSRVLKWSSEACDLIELSQVADRGMIPLFLKTVEFSCLLPKKGGKEGQIDFALPQKAGAGAKPRSFQMLDKHSTTELCPESLIIFRFDPEY